MVMAQTVKFLKMADRISRNLGCISNVDISYFAVSQCAAGCQSHMYVIGKDGNDIDWVSYDMISKLCHHNACR